HDHPAGRGVLSRWRATRCPPAAGVAGDGPDASHRLTRIVWLRDVRKLHRPICRLLRQSRSRSGVDVLALDLQPRIARRRRAQCLLGGANRRRELSTPSTIGASAHLERTAVSEKPKPRARPAERSITANLI